MTWKAPLDQILGSLTKVRVLRCLWQAEAPMSGRAIARRTGLSHTGVMSALEDLCNAGVVVRVPDAPAPRHRLNRDHVLVREGLLGLLEAEAGLDEHLGAFILERIPQVLSAVLIGSAARRQDAPTSDLDVVVVVSDDQDPEAAPDLITASETLVRFGRLIEPIVWTRSELERRVRKGSPLIAAIHRDGKLLAGRPIDTLVRKSSRRAG